MSADSFGRKQVYIPADYNSVPKPIKFDPNQIDNKEHIEPIKSTTPTKIKRSNTFESDNQN